MNILLAFKAEPDAGMLAEKEWQAAATANYSRMFHCCEVYPVLMNRPPPQFYWRREKAARR